MTKSPLRIVTGVVLAFSLAVSSAGVANADNGHHNKVVAKAPSKVVVVNQRSRHTGRNVGLGVAAAVVAGVVIAGSASASERMSCRALERRCDDGQNWACRRLEVRDDC